MVFSKVYIYCCMNFIQSIFFSSLFSMPAEVQHVRYRQISLCRLVAGLIGWMDGSGCIVGCLHGNAWLVGCLEEVAKWMQLDLLCFGQIEDTIF